MHPSAILLRIRNFDIPSLSVIILWVLTFVSTPIVGRVFGETALQRMIILGVLLQVTAVIVILARSSMGLKNTILIVIAVLPLAWLAEFIGSQTGFPFGAYSYTELLQPQVGGVPLLIPLAWFMMLPPSWAVATLIVFQIPQYSLSIRFVRALVAALAFTAWDLYLDPQMVAWNFWQWEIPGFYYGIPLVNFAGWLLVSFIISFVFLPSRLPLMPLLSIYAITWLLQFVGQLLFWHLVGPAFFGFLGMGVMLLFVLWQHSRFKNVINLA
jgi:lycopene beta-cyclase